MQSRVWILLFFWLLNFGSCHESTTKITISTYNYKRRSLNAIYGVDFKQRSFPHILICNSLIQIYLNFVLFLALLVSCHQTKNKQWQTFFLHQVFHLLPIEQKSVEYVHQILAYILCKYIMLPSEIRMLLDNITYKKSIYFIKVKNHTCLYAWT